jgi:hypothetical protein
MTLNLLHLRLLVELSIFLFRFNQGEKRTESVASASGVARAA